MDHVILKYRCAAAHQILPGSVNHDTQRQACH
jgi:hypothetical protein